MLKESKKSLLGKKVTFEVVDECKDGTIIIRNKFNHQLQVLPYQVKLIDAKL